MNCFSCGQPIGEGEKHTCPHMVKELNTSATKADAKKTRLDLLPVRPLEDIGWVLDYGAKKYFERNWEAGFSWHRLYGSTLRHLFAWWRGEDLDPESKMHHLAHAACNILFLLEFTHTGAGTDDRPILRKTGGSNLQTNIPGKETL